MVLDAVFIQNFGMGGLGAAWATLIAQLASSLMLHLHSAIEFFATVEKEDFHLTKNEYATHLNAGLPMAFQSSIIAIGTVIFGKTALNSLGTDVVAAPATAGRIDQSALNP